MPLAIITINCSGRPQPLPREPPHSTLHSCSIVSPSRAPPPPATSQHAPQLLHSEPLPQPLHRQPELLGEDGVAVRVLGAIGEVRGKNILGLLVLVDDLDVVLLPLHLHGLQRLRPVLEAVLDPKHRVHREHLPQRVHLLEYLLHPLLGVHPEAEDVPSAPLRGLHNERGPELGVADADGLHLEVGHRDVEVLRHVGVPHQPHVGDEERAEVALVAAEVPHPVDLVVALLVGQEDELLVLNNRAAELEVAVQLGGVVGPEHRLDGGEETRRVAHEVGEYKLKAAPVELREHVQRLRGPSQPRGGAADVDADDGVVPYAQIGLAILVRAPDQPQVCDGQLAALPVVPFCVLH
mmetsp:Transcript_64068/g.202684  ORF Transcript_64068/g.202684 Transcript_64068/m.202684 type:complete len:351 (+) Transcript_64068:119-1171(+)